MPLAIEPSYADQASALAGVGAALRRLRPGASLQAIFDHATQGLCESLGFDRAAVFSLRGHTLVAESVYPRGAGAGLSSHPLRLGPWLRESEVLRRRTAVLVRDAGNDPRALGTVPGAGSYVAAPVLCEGNAVALVHADRGVTGPAATELDRDALAAFAEGLGYALERCVLAERLRAQAARVLGLLRSTEAAVSELSRPETELPAPGRRPASEEGPATSDRELQTTLTRREREVLAMLAEGETNSRIAQRLVLSEDTVKTHVKHILRKLGVQNRSQAVSRYFRSHAAEGNGATPGYRLG